MRFLGFSFDKINATRMKTPIILENIKTNSNLNLLEIRELKEHILNIKEIVFEAEFSYLIEYSPEIAKIELIGKVVFSLEQKEAKEFLQNWKKKELQDDFKLPLLNIILRKSNLKALSLEEELNLPPHIPLPSIKKTENP